MSKKMITWVIVALIVVVAGAGFALEGEDLVGFMRIKMNLRNFVDLSQEEDVEEFSWCKNKSECGANMKCVSFDGALPICVTDYLNGCPEGYDFKLEPYRGSDFFKVSCILPLPETVCDDGEDNDDDGFVDCMDKDCLGQTNAEEYVCCKGEGGAGGGNDEGCEEGYFCDNGYENETYRCIQCEYDSDCSEGECVDGLCVVAWGGGTLPEEVEAAETHCLDVAMGGYETSSDFVIYPGEEYALFPFHFIVSAEESIEVHKIVSYWKGTVSDELMTGGVFRLRFDDEQGFELALASTVSSDNKKIFFDFSPYDVQIFPPNFSQKIVLTYEFPDFVEQGDLGWVEFGLVEFSGTTGPTDEQVSACASTLPETLMMFLVGGE